MIVNYDSSLQYIRIHVSVSYVIKSVTFQCISNLHSAPSGAMMLTGRKISRHKNIILRLIEMVYTLAEIHCIISSLNKDNGHRKHLQPSDCADPF